MDVNNKTNFLRGGNTVPSDHTVSLALEMLLLAFAPVSVINVNF